MTDLTGNTIAVWGVFAFYGCIGLACWKASRGARNREWRHKRRGTVYERIGGAEVQSSRGAIHEGDVLTVYRDKDGKLWARPAEEFHDGRFARV